MIAIARPNLWLPPWLAPRRAAARSPRRPWRRPLALLLDLAFKGGHLVRTASGPPYHLATSCGGCPPCPGTLPSSFSVSWTGTFTLGTGCGFAIDSPCTTAWESLVYGPFCNTGANSDTGYEFHEPPAGDWYVPAAGGKCCTLAGFFLSGCYPLPSTGLPGWIAKWTTCAGTMYYENPSLNPVGNYPLNPSNPANSNPCGSSWPTSVAIA